MRSRTGCVPDHLLQQAKDGRHGSGRRKSEEHHAFGRRNSLNGGDTRARRRRLIWPATRRQHPIRIAITVGAVTWWMLRGRDRSLRLGRRGRHVVGRRRMTRYDEPAIAARQGRRLRRQRARDGRRVRRDRARDGRSNTRRPRARRVGEYASTRARDRRRVRAVGARRARAARIAAACAAPPARRRRRVDDWVHENPLAAGVIALAVGAAIGLSVPRTEIEDRAMGEARDRARGEARQRRWPSRT